MLKKVKEKIIDFIVWLDAPFDEEPQITPTELYLKFRSELDKMWVPVVLDKLTVRLVKHNKETVGILCTEGNYIDCLYVLPFYRKRGLGKKAVMEWLKETKYQTVSLHIINNNRVALSFWKDIFDLTLITQSETDALYKGKVKK